MANNDKSAMRDLGKAAKEKGKEWSDRAQAEIQDLKSKNDDTLSGKAKGELHEQKHRAEAEMHKQNAELHADRAKDKSNKH